MRVDEMDKNYCAYDAVHGKCMRRPRASMAQGEADVRQTTYLL